MYSLRTQHSFSAQIWNKNWENSYISLRGGIEGPRQSGIPDSRQTGEEHSTEVAKLKEEQKSQQDIQVRILHGLH